MSHSHPSSHPSHTATTNIKVAFFLNLAFSLFELIGGLFTNSIAILSDALHDFGDSFSLALSRYFQNLSHKKRTLKYSYGYRRFSLLGALISSVVLLVGSFFIISESIQRFITPQTADAKGMFLLAIVGIVVNGIAFLRLKKGVSLNERAVGLHLLEDVLGWIAVFIGSIVMMIVDVPWLDPVLSLGIAAYILFNIYRNIRDIFRVVLQAVPEQVHSEEVEKVLVLIPHVKAIHDLHLRSMDGEYVVASLHIVVDSTLSFQEISGVKYAVKQALKGLEIHHITVEIEQEEEICDNEECA